MPVRAPAAARSGSEYGHSDRTADGSFRSPVRCPVRLHCLRGDDCRHDPSTRTSSLARLLRQDRARRRVRRARLGGVPEEAGNVDEPGRVLVQGTPRCSPCRSTGSITAYAACGRCASCPTRRGAADAIRHAPPLLRQGRPLRRGRAGRRGADRRAPRADRRLQPRGTHRPRRPDRPAAYSRGSSAARSSLASGAATELLVALTKAVGGTIYPLRRRHGRLPGRRALRRGGPRAALPGLHPAPVHGRWGRPSSCPDCRCSTRCSTSASTQRPRCSAEPHHDRRSGGDAQHQPRDRPRRVRPVR